MTNLDKIIELIDEEISNEELEQREKDIGLFIEIFNIFNRMSLVGKVTTIQSLFSGLIKEMEVKRKC